MPFSIVDMQWPGKEFIQIEHLGTNTIVKLNNKHPFFTRIYSPVLKAAGALDGKKEEGQATLPTPEEFQQMARLLHVGLDLLILAYAKAESMKTDPKKIWRSPQPLGHVSLQHDPEDAVSVDHLGVCLLGTEFAPAGIRFPAPLCSVRAPKLGSTHQ